MTMPNIALLRIYMKDFIYVMMTAICGTINAIQKNRPFIRTIPVVFELCDELANSFTYKINQSSFNGAWGSDVQLKIGKFNRIFPEEYTGELYAGRIENGG